MRKRRINNIFENMTSFEGLLRAFGNASFRKNNRFAVLSFRHSLESNVFALQERLRDGSYTFGPYRSFYVYIPKKRLIESACFKDRVVHHAIYERLEPLFDVKFFEHSYACRTGRGTHAAMMKLHEWIRNSKRPVFLKCDIRKFFPSINREMLLGILRREISDKKLLELLEKLILTAPNTGLPIGNLTSQLFANVYLNELDQFVKRQLCERYYIRYMDDFVILLNTQDEARVLKEKIKNFLAEKLKLELSPEKVRIGLLREGVPFVGFCLRPGGVRIRGASLRRLRQKVRIAYKKSFGTEYEQPEKFWEDPLMRRTKFFASYSSYVGQTKYVSGASYLQARLKRELDLFPP